MKVHMRATNNTATATRPVNLDLELARMMMASTATTAIGAASPFEPSLWADYFVTYTPPPSQRSEEWMREKADKLKRQVRRMFDAPSVMSAANSLTLVDALERLGIDHHFQEEIDAALCRVHSEETESITRSSDELHVAALRFRLLRQHGLFVSTDVFHKYKDGTGAFSLGLTGDDPRGLLSLYNAAHMAVPGEDILDDVISFTRSHLIAVKGIVGSPLSDQIKRALDIPLPRYMRGLETLHYITEYEKEEGHDATVLQLARLNYSITRCLHLKEIRTFCLWWINLYEDVKLTYSRDRAVEIYLWAFGMFPGEGNSSARLIMSKMIALVSIMDDTFDAHATIEDCENFDEAMQRMDESAASILPEYLQAFYIKLISSFNELEDILHPCEKYPVSYLRKEYVVLSKYYLVEAKWGIENYMPSFNDHLDLSTMTSAMPALTIAALMALGKQGTKKAFEWASSAPDMVRACGEVGRFLNDISAFKKGRKNKNDMATSLECYMEEHGTTGKTAAAVLLTMVDSAWRRMNKALMEIDRALLPAVNMAVINQARVIEVVYFGGNDGYTFTGDIDGVVTSLFLKPVPQFKC